MWERFVIIQQVTVSAFTGKRCSLPMTDNDIASNNSAVKSKSAWWHKKYFTCNLNGIYGPNITSDGIKWKHFRGLKQPLPRAQMMERRKLQHQY